LAFSHVSFSQISFSHVSFTARRSAVSFQAQPGIGMTMQQDSVNSEVSRRGARPAWTETWHLWRVIIPRRSITGKLLYGKVWRRHTGRHWIYKRFVEFDERT
jgi:hypothetical protein